MRRYWEDILWDDILWSLTLLMGVKPSDWDVWCNMTSILLPPTTFLFVVEYATSVGDTRKATAQTTS